MSEPGARSENQAKIDAEIERLGAMSDAEVAEEMLAGMAQNAAWAPFEESWAIQRCLRNRAPWN